MGARGVLKKYAERQWGMPLALGVEGVHSVLAYVRPGGYVADIYCLYAHLVLRC